MNVCWFICASAMTEEMLLAALANVRDMLPLYGDTKDGMPMATIWWDTDGTRWPWRRYGISICASRDRPSRYASMSYLELVAAVESRDIAGLCPGCDDVEHANEAWMRALGVIAYPDGHQPWQKLNTTACLYAAPDSPKDDVDSARRG